jgi:hypothetical protein
MKIKIEVNHNWVTSNNWYEVNDNITGEELEAIFIRLSKAVKKEFKII